LAAAAVLICAAAAWFFLAHRSGPVTPPPVRPPVAAGPAGGSGQTPGIGAENGGKKPGEQASEKAPRRSAPEKTRTVKGAAQKAKSQQESSASDLAKAEGLFKKGRLDDAEKLVGEVLDRENDNQKALDLRKNIEAARSLQ
jgi:hypothetical protein